MAQYNWITIKESPDWIVDYDSAKGRYRVSYFENGHFKDEVIFREFEEPEAVDADCFIACPYCLVCSVTTTDFNNDGIAVCRVCGQEIHIDECCK